jgi:mannonate dehydratase
MALKLGLALARDMLTEENLRFARQASVTHIVAHSASAGINSPGSKMSGWRRDLEWNKDTRIQEGWSLDRLAALKRTIEDNDLELAAIENFDPLHWYDVLLDGPRRDDQVEAIVEMIERVGEVGIPCIGYNFSLAGVWGRTVGPFGRGGATTYRLVSDQAELDRPIPSGQLWGVTYSPRSRGTIGSVTADEMWDRLRRFLADVVPAAERAGVRLAAHPDDPPLPELRGTARLLTSPESFDRLLDLYPSPSNALEFCQGTIASMPGVDVLELIDRYCRRKAVAYVHFRNVRGKCPHHDEVFLDEGDVDMRACLRLYASHGFDGVLIPDHTPFMTTEAPWHTGFAFALGYMRAAISEAEEAA